VSIFDALGGNEGWEAPDPAPLTDEQVADIRKLYHECGWRQVDIADQFGISQPYVSRIVNLKRRKR
jgi:DNA-binding transcriptional regulator LsrR (DeoR family)